VLLAALDWFADLRPKTASSAAPALAARQVSLAEAADAAAACLGHTAPAAAAALDARLRAQAGPSETLVQHRVVALLVDARGEPPRCAPLAAPLRPPCAPLAPPPP